MPTTRCADANLQDSLGKLKVGFSERRRQAAERLPEFEALRDRARDIKNHTLANLDFYLEEFERKVIGLGGHVHWAPTAEDARRIIADLCKSVGARTIAKSKSMISEEIGLNDHLEALGIEPVETDLGEYIIQLRHEPPSHIIAPAVHLTKDQVADTFLEHHRALGFTKRLTERNDLVAEARQVLRQKFLDADVGLTGANFLVAETGSSMLVTNEGNADLSNTLPKMHIVLASIEKVIPTLEDAAVLLRVLARSATGQESSAYTTLNTGPKRAGDLDGPSQYHVVILDNGRSSVLGTKMQDMLRCIRCGACMNHCPVYGAIGGHAYGWVYPGPIGAVLTPQLIGVEEAGNLPNASTFCGRCESVCPVRIPLPGLMRHWREREFERHLTPRAVRQGLALWSFVARRPKLYRRLTGLGQQAARPVRPRRRPLSQPAAGVGLDALPRLPGAAAGRHLPRPVGAPAQPDPAMSARVADPRRHPPLAPSRRAHGRRPRDRRAAPRRAAARARRSPAPSCPSPRRWRCSANGPRPTTPRSPASRRREVPAEVAGYLARNNLPASAAMAPSPQLDGYDWASQKMLSLRRGRAEASDHVSITGAFAGIAETGTLVMASGPEHPVSLNLLPDTHVVVLREADIVGGLRGRLGAPARALRQGRHAAHGQHHHRPVAHRRHRAGHGTRRPRAAAHAHRGGARMTAAGDAPPPPRKGELHIVGTTVGREVERLLDKVAEAAGRRVPRVLQVGSRGSVSDRNELNWRSLVAKRFDGRARFVGIDLLAGPDVDHQLDICSSPQAIASTLGREAFDLVVCCHVLEHTPAPMRAARNIEALLRPGGLAYVSTPWSQAFHAAPDDYWRFSRRGLCLLFRRLEILSSFYSGGDVGLDVAYRVERDGQPGARGARPAPSSGACSSWCSTTRTTAPCWPARRPSGCRCRALTCRPCSSIWWDGGCRK